MKKYLFLLFLLCVSGPIVAQQMLNVADMIQIQQSGNMRFSDELLQKKGYQRFDATGLIADSLASRNHWYAQGCDLDDHFFPVAKPEATASVVEVMEKSHYFVSLIVYSESLMKDLATQIVNEGYHQEPTNLGEQHFCKGESFFYIYPNSVHPSYWTILLGWQIDIDEI